MAVIVKADIVTAVNKKLKKSFSDDDIDEAILSTLTDMSNRDLLVGTDDSQELEADDTTLDYPTGYRTQISITLIDESEVESQPLEKLPGGHNQYRHLRDNDNSNGRPDFFSEFKEQFYLWRPADQDYTSLIEYYKDHAADVDNIEFETKHQSVMYAGVAFWAATNRNMKTYMALWGPLYERELNAAEANMVRQPYIVRG